MKQKQGQIKNNKDESEKSREEQAKKGLGVIGSIFQVGQLGVMTTTGVISNFFRSAGVALKGLGQSNIVLMGLTSAIGMVFDYLKIRDLWQLRNKYAKLKVDQETDEQRKKRLEKQIRTTSFTVASRIAEVGLLIVLSLATVGIITMASPLVLGFAVAMGSIGIIKHSYNLIRQGVLRYRARKELKSLTQPKNKFEFDQKLAAKETLVNSKYKNYNSAIKLGLTILALAVIGSIVFFTGPLSTLLIPCALVGIVALNIVYQKAIKPKLQQKQSAEIAQVKKAHDAEFDRWNETHDSLDDKLDKARESSMREAASHKGDFDHHLEKVRERDRQSDAGSHITDTSKKLGDDEQDGEEFHL